MKKCDTPVDSYAWPGFPFPLSEAYFVHNDHPDFSLHPDAGAMLVLHLPTNDLWMLTGHTDCLYVTRLVESATANSAELREIQRLRQAARQFVGEPQLSHPKTNIDVDFEPRFRLQESPNQTTPVWGLRAGE
jgi:hypothetical protein